MYCMADEDEFFNAIYKVYTEMKGWTDQRGVASATLALESLCAEMGYFYKDIIEECEDYEMLGA